jgi:DNA-binding IscR family transcriptional regulator
MITLLDIVLAIEGPAPAFRCSEIRRRGPNPLSPDMLTKPCNINSAMLRAEKAYRAELKRVSIADILSDVGAIDDGTIAQRSCSFLQIHERKSGPDNGREPRFPEPFTGE